MVHKHKDPSQVLSESSMVRMGAYEIHAPAIPAHQSTAGCDYSGFRGSHHCTRPYITEELENQPEATEHAQLHKQN